MQSNMNNGFGMMNGYGSWPIVAVLLVAILAVLIFRSSKKK